MTSQKAFEKLTCLSCAQVNRVPVDRVASGKCGTCGAPLWPGSVAEIDPDTLARAIRNDTVPLVVDFWAPWCGPCRMMAPEYAQAAKRMAGRTRFAKLDTEAHPAAGTRHGIRGIPTMALFTGGREAKRQSGALRTPQILEWLGG